MKLEDYLSTEKLTRKQFAGIIGKSPSIITRILKKQTNPDLDTLEAIEHGTAGIVTAQDFYKKKPAVKKKLRR